MEVRFAESERRALAALPAAERSARFFDFWTLKESYVKAHGLGLAMGLQGVAFELGGDAPRICFDGGDEDPDDWQFELLHPTPRHVMALCLRKGRGRRAALRLRQTP